MIEQNFPTDLEKAKEEEVWRAEKQKFKVSEVIRTTEDILYPTIPLSKQQVENLRDRLHLIAKDLVRSSYSQLVGPELLPFINSENPKNQEVGLASYRVFYESASEDNRKRIREVLGLPRNIIFPYQSKYRKDS